MDLSFPLIEFLSFPCVMDNIARPSMTVICLKPCACKQGELTMSYSDAFEMGLAGLIDYAKPKPDIEAELYAVKQLCDRIAPVSTSPDHVQLLLAEKYFKMSWKHRDYDCIHTVGKYLMALPAVQAKTAIFKDISLICDQIECRACCDEVDGQLCLLELNQHVFLDVA